MFFNVEQALADHATLIDYIKVFNLANDLVFNAIFLVKYCWCTQ